MNASWDLAKLDPTAFEHLVNALALRVLGNGATGFGPGADAGRDGFFEGKAAYPSALENWDGVWYIQSKFLAPHLSKDPQAWLLAQVESELKAFRDSQKQRIWPDNWILATNVELSGGRGGTFDKLRKLLSGTRPELAKRFHVWGAQKIIELLSLHQEIATRYRHFLTPGHVISELLDNLATERGTADRIIRAFIIHGIKEQRRTKIEQAGSREDQPPGIEALFVDLPFKENQCKTEGDAVATLAQAAAECHRLDDLENSGDTMRCWKRHPRRASVWFIHAGPGRGKSTIGQFFCQIQRAAIIAQDKTWFRRPDLKGIVESVRKKAEELGVWPKTPRIPMWIELKSYAAWFADQPPREPRGVLSWLASEAKRLVEAPVPTATIQRALRQGAWIAVFDGLDEVPSSIKDDIANEVVNFVHETIPESDLMTLCTSRPQGYSGQFDVLSGAAIELVDLNSRQALDCASRVTQINRSEAESAAARAILQRALETPSVMEIMTTPLQCHIMAVLVRNGARPPERKWDLYARFYEVIREREANRDLPDHRLKSLLQGDPRIIDAVHQRLGFILHAKAETAAGAEASLSRSDFRTLVREVVVRFGTSGNVEEMVNIVTTAATDRLVLINTPDSGSHVRFDVRAIQEFFAAGFLYEDVEVQDLRRRLEVVAGDSHWREVVQFILQALVSTRRRTERSVAFDVLRWLDAGQNDSSCRAFARLIGNGAIHAGLLLANNVAETDQQVRAQLRDLLDPLGSGNNHEMPTLLGRSSGPQTRAMLWAWAIDFLRTRKISEASGAVDTAVALGLSGGVPGLNMLSSLNGLPTRALNAILSEAIQEGGDIPFQGWEDEALQELFKRSDVVREAPTMVFYALYAAIGKADAGRMQAANLDRLAGVNSLFSREEVVVDGIFRVERVLMVRTAKARLATKARTTNEAPLIRWLIQLMKSAQDTSASLVREVLLNGPDDWYVYRVLPRDLLKNIPLPVPYQSAINPWQFAELLQDMTDVELEQQLNAREVCGVRLSRGFNAVRLDPELRPDASLADADPELLFRSLRYLSGGHKAEWAIYRSLLQTAILKHPSKAGILGPDALFRILEGCGPETRDIVRAISCTMTLEIQWVRFGILPEVPIILPQDQDLLVLLANRLLAEVFSTRGRYALRDTDSDKRGAAHSESVVRRIPALEDLLHVVHDAGGPNNVRAAALLLAAMHPSGGIRILSAQQALLRDFVLQGVAPIRSIAVVLEGIRADRKMGDRILSDLLSLEANIAGAHGLSSVMGRWRERSQAPVTTQDCLSAWLEGRA